MPFLIDWHAVVVRLKQQTKEKNVRERDVTKCVADDTWRISFFLPFCNDLSITTEERMYVGQYRPLCRGCVNQRLPGTCFVCSEWITCVATRRALRGMLVLWAVVQGHCYSCGWTQQVWKVTSRVPGDPQTWESGQETYFPSRLFAGFWAYSVDNVLE